MKKTTFFVVALSAFFPLPVHADAPPVKTEAAKKWPEYVDRADALRALLAAAEAQAAQTSLALAQLARVGDEVIAHRQARTQEKMVALERAKAMLKERYGIDVDAEQGWDGDATVEGAKLRVRRRPPAK